ncbi:ATPase synthesis protein 25 mitochondrial [Sticta canariensis]|nr:ATPase synthesis protein 25 mitochondrial [Sticta canariensis]
MSVSWKCGSCRRSLLRAFVSTFADLPIRNGAVKLNTTKSSIKAFDPVTPIRPFTAINPRRSDNAHQESILPENIKEEKLLDAEQNTEYDEGMSELVSPQPWYLQVQTPRRESRSLSERQRLPELPPDPPPLLQPILEHISIDLGLDDLCLFDLRELDPPPALGANLLVILGTARSEKHLHVSADRFCRWLRTAHKLTPYADGLMGRGELKQKMRRKARRARILSRVGSSERYSQDDGLTTGWICVNVGTIQDGKGASEEYLEPEDFVGFGEKVGGAKVVIQMLTEEKRMELDLEELWENMLKIHKRKEAKIKNSEAAVNDGPSDHNFLQEQILSSNPSSMVLSSHQKPSVGNHPQRRDFHSSTSHLDSNFIRNMDVRSQDMDEYSRNMDEYYRIMDEYLKLDTLRSKPRDNREIEPDLDLESLLDYLRSLQGEDACKALGTGINDWGSTSFLSSFYQSYPLFPQEDHWEYRFALVCHAIKIGHPRYDKRDLLVLVHQMRTTFVYLPPRIALRIIDIFLSRRAPARSNVITGMEFSFSERDFLYSLEIFDTVQHKVTNTYVRRILMILYAATAHVSVSEFSLRLKPNAIACLRRHMDSITNLKMDTETHATVLNIFALKKNWEAFWRHWNGIAGRLQPRPAELYASFFHIVAKTKNQIQCIDALRNFVPEMYLERPPVKLEGEVAKAVMECLRIVAPGLESNWMMPDWKSETRWFDLWRRCYLSTRDSSLPDLSIEQLSTLKSEGSDIDSGLVPSN